MRDKRGRFLKGSHWRKAQPFRSKAWLQEHYVLCGKSAGEIAVMFGVTDNAIYFWLQKHGIKRRTVASARKLKHWGSFGADNPMWNRKGELNPNWKGGISAERAAFYASNEWKAACARVWKRDKSACQRCHMRVGRGDMPAHIHHIESFATEALRAKTSNLVLLCEACHQFVHSRKNVNREFLPQTRHPA